MACCQNNKCSEEVEFIDENSMDKGQNKSVKHDSGAADLEKVTDFVEEKEIASKDIEDVSIENT